MDLKIDMTVVELNDLQYSDSKTLAEDHTCSKCKQTCAKMGLTKKYMCIQGSFEKRRNTIDYIYLCDPCFIKTEKLLEEGNYILFDDDKFIISKSFQCNSYFN